MIDLLGVVGLAVLLFASTNIDDIFVLVAFFADAKLRPRQVWIGQYLGIGALVALSVAGSLLALVVPGEYLGLLGMLPFALGCLKLIQLLRERPDGDDEPGKRGRGVLAVALVTFANGGDNLGAYIPVFATHSWLGVIVTVVVFLGMTAVWCMIGQTLVTHPRVGPTIRRIATPTTPFVLMAIGVVIVVESGAYRLVVP